MPFSQTTISKTCRRRFQQSQVLCEDLEKADLLNLYISILEINQVTTLYTSSHIKVSGPTVHFDLD